MSSYSWENFGIGTDQIKISNEDIFYLDSIDSIKDQDERLLKKINKYSINVPVVKPKKITKPPEEVKFLYRELSELEKKNDNMMLLMFFLIVIIIIQYCKNKSNPVMMLITEPKLNHHTLNHQMLNSKALDSQPKIPNYTPNDAKKSSFSPA